MQKVVWIASLLSPFLLLGKMQTQILKNDPKHQTMHPVQADQPIRRTSANSKPQYSLTLHYAPSGYLQQDTYYSAAVKWHFRDKALVVSDSPEIDSINCRAEGISLTFKSIKDLQEAEAWDLPLILITEGNQGLCAYDLPGEEQYHPIMIDSRQESNLDSRTLTFVGYRSRWNMVGLDHEVKIERVTRSESSSLVRRRLQDPPEFDFNPSVNYNPVTQSAAEAGVPMTLFESDNVSVEMVCDNCYFHADVHFALETGSRIINVAVNSLVKIVIALHHAEQALKASLERVAHSMKESMLRKFEILSRDLSDAFSEFTHQLSELTQFPPRDEAERFAREDAVREAAALTRRRADRLVATTGAELDNSVNSGLSPEQKLQVILLVQETVRATEREIEKAAEDISLTAIREADVCPDESETDQNDQNSHIRRSLEGTQEASQGRYTFCRYRRRRASSKITGNINANVDVTLTLTGKVEFGTGDLTLFSAGLAGISIPNVCQFLIQTEYISCI